MTVWDVLNSALHEEMSADLNVFLMGEEVGAFQGTYKVPKAQQYVRVGFVHDSFRVIRTPCFGSTRFLSYLKRLAETLNADLKQCSDGKAGDIRLLPSQPYNMYSWSRCFVGIIFR